MNSNRLVVNASPIISLAKLGKADILPALFSELVIPEGVVEEICSHRIIDSAVQWLQQKAKPFIKPVPVVPQIADWNLGRGETDVISYAYLNKGFIVAIDDKPAKKCAELYGIKVNGTLSLIIKAKKHGVIQEASPLLSGLRENGFRISDSLLSKAQRLANE